MQSHTKENYDNFSVKTIWLLLAISLNALELLLPRLPFLPWLKPGLANCITVIWIVRYGVKDAILFTLLRSWISGFYFGFSLVTLALSVSGGILATAAMGLAWETCGKRGWLGSIGLSIIGAFFHNTAQLFVVYLLLTHNYSVFYQLPFMAAASIFFGAVSGLIVPQLNNILINIRIENVRHNNIEQRYTISPAHTSICFAILIFCILLFTISNMIILTVTCLSVTIGISVFFRSWKIIYYPLRFWLLFLFIFSMYLFFSYGTRLPVFTFITYEGLNNALLQIIRVWTWLEAGLLLTRFRFHDTFFSILRMIFKNSQTTLVAGILALQYFPEVVSFAKSRESISGLSFFRKPSFAINEYVNRMLVFISSRWENVST